MQHCVRPVFDAPRSPVQLLNNWNVIVIRHPGYQAFMTYDEVEVRPTARRLCARVQPRGATCPAHGRRLIITAFPAFLSSPF